MAIQAILWHRVQAISTHGFETKLSVLKLPSLAMTRSMFTLLQASNGMDGCAQINGQFILAPFAEVLTLDGWCDDIVRHVVYRQPVMGVVDLASWS